MMLTRFLLATVAIIAVSSVHAADLPYRKGPPVYTPPPPIFTWTGAYIGLNAGYAFSNHNDIDIGYPSSGGSTGPISVAAVSISRSADSIRIRDSSNGFTGGGQIGYNYQFGAGSGIVIGLELDAEYMDLNHTSKLSLGDIAGGALIGEGGNVTAKYKTSLDYLATVRGRAGYAFDRFLIYGTGGFAFGGVNRTLSLAVADIPEASASFHDTETGWAAGGGIEYALPSDSFLNFLHSSAVTLKAEYLHYDLGHTDATASLLGETVSVHLKDSGDLARGGINFKF